MDLVSSPNDLNKVLRERERETFSVNEFQFYQYVDLKQVYKMLFQIHNITSVFFLGLLLMGLLVFLFFFFFFDK